jgi:hypothetical protein
VAGNQCKKFAPNELAFQRHWRTVHATQQTQINT